MIEIQIRNSDGALEPGSERRPGIDGAEGEGQILCQRLFDGISILRLRLEMRSFVERRTRPGLFEINFCANGRFESRFSAREHVLLRPGDMAVSRFDGVHGRESESCFPLGHYEGLCVEVEPERAQRWLNANAPAFAVDFRALRRGLLGDGWFMYAQAGPHCAHVFRELYENLPGFDAPYLRMKAVELLMLLERLHRAEREQSYCAAEQLRWIERLRDHLLSDCDQRTSLARLAEAHGTSVSHMQKLFKRIYGAPIYRYVKEYRLERAAVALVKTRKRVTEIALDAGYDSASKFAQCFKARYGVSPSEYRANSRLEWNSRSEMG